MYRLSEICLHHRIVTFVAAALIVAASIYATLQFKIALMPSLTYPAFVQITTTSEMDPQKVLDDTTIPIENAFSSQEGLKNMLSISAPGLSMIMGEFPFGTDPDKTGEAIQEEMEKISLPPGTMSLFMPFSMDLMPPVVLGMGSPTSDPATDQEIIEAKIIPELKKIDGVIFMPGQEVIGGGSKQVIVDPDAEKMNQLGISFAQLMDILGTPEFSSVSDIQNTVVSSASKDVTLADIAEIYAGLPPGFPICQRNGVPGVAIMVAKDPAANTVEVANAVMAKIEEIEPTLPEGFEIHTIIDQAEMIEESMDGLVKQAGIGAILAIIVIFLFLFTARASIITVISMPLSLLLGFLLMYLCGLDINILTLGAIAMAVGRVVDNTIVVLENIYRHRGMGESFATAASNGCREVANAITSSTIATLVVFVPLVLIGGMAVVMFRPFALAFTLILVASLIVALMLIPPLSSYIAPRKATEGMGYRGESWYQRIYTRWLKWSLQNRALTLGVTVVVFLASFAIIPIVGTYLIPEMAEPMLIVETELPSGSSTKEVAQKLAQTEEVVKNVGGYEYMSVGGGADVSGGGALSYVSLGSVLMGGSTSIADTMALLSPGANLKETVEKFDQAAKEIEGARVMAYTPERMADRAGMGPSALQVSLYGEDPQRVEQVSKEVLRMLEGTEGLTNVRSAAVVEPMPEFYPEVDPQKAKEYNLIPEEVEWEVSELKQDQLVNFVYLEGKEREIYIEGIGKGLKSKQQWENIFVGAENPVRLGDIATIEERPAPPFGVRRYNQKEVEFITASIVGKDKGTISREITSAIEGIPHSGVEVEIGGVEEMMEENFGYMYIAIIGAIILLFFTLVIIFRSFLNAAMIMVSLPLACIGAFLALLITQTPVGMIGLMGVIMLLGVVLTNAIVLLVFVEQLRKGGMSTYDSLVEGGRVRLRPILMTALTTIFAMFPLAFAATYGGVVIVDLAIVVIGGLISSTILTLIILPVIYSLVHRT